MNIVHRAHDGGQFIRTTAEGRLDLESSKEELTRLTQDSELRVPRTLLLDLRKVDCRLGTLDVYELCQHVTALPRFRDSRIAVVVTGQDEFDLARFMENCSQNRGVQLAAFPSLAEAKSWLGTGDVGPPED